MTNRTTKHVLLASAAVAGVLALGACDKKDAGNAPGATNAKVTGAAGKLAPPEVQMKDLSENAPAYTVGISFDKEVGQYKAAAERVQSFADKAVADFKAAAAKLPATKDISHKPTLSLGITSVANTSHFAAIAANGSQYLSGAAAQPILKRWVWLPASGSELTVEQLMSTPAAKSILSARGGANVIGMEPIADADGKIAAIYFVTAAPAGNEADAVDKFVLTADQLKTLVDPKYAALLGSPPKPKQ